MVQSDKKQLSAKKKHFINKDDKALYVMALPTVIFLIIFCYMPMIGLIMAFQDYNVSLLDWQTLNTCLPRPMRGL